MFCRSLPILSALVVLVGLGSPVLAQDEVAAGRAEYEIACQSCHGDKGKGDGPLAQYLTIKPSDLSQLTKINHGTYPFLQVFQVIDGRSVVKAHGTGPMPIWGDRYTVASGVGGTEPYKTYGAEPFVRARILELTYFIQTLQE